jgi:hypothetical protein
MNSKVVVLSALVIVLVVVLGINLLPRDNQPSGKTEPIPAASPAGNPVSQGDQTLLGLHKAGEPWLNTLRAAYRLKPDRRFLLALGEVDAFLRNTEPKIATAHFDDLRWQVRYGEQEVGSLSPHPDFKEYMDLVIGFARRIDASVSIANGEPGSHPEIEALLNPYLAPAQWNALRKIDTLWNDGVRTTELLRLGARAYAELEFQRLDTLEVSDALSATSIAQFALANAHGAENLRREEFMLSWGLGYKSHAKNVALEMPSNTPLTWFASHKDELLANGNVPEHLKTETSYLNFRRAVLTYPAKSNFAEFSKWAEETFFEEKQFLTIYSEFVEHAEWVHASDLSFFFASAVLEEMATFSSGLAKPLTEIEQVLTEFDERAGYLESQFQGPFLTNEAIRGYYEGMYVSGLYRLGLVQLDSRADQGAAEQLAGVLSGDPDGAVDQFRNWYSLLANQMKNPVQDEELFANVTALNRLGAPAANRLFQDGLKYSPFGNPATLAVSKHLFHRMDSRPSSLSMASDTAWTKMNWKGLSTNLFEAGSKLDDEGFTWQTSWFTAREKDTEGLLGYANDRSQPLEVRKNALYHMRLFELGQEALVHEAYESLLAEFPGTSSVLYEYLKFLTGLEEYAKIVAVVKNWLSRYDGDNSVLIANLNARAAKALHELDRNQEAWELLKPGIEGSVGSSMTTGSSVLHAMNEHENDIELARRSYKRYPQSNFDALKVAEIHWLHGDHDEAAAVLSQARNRMNVNFWMNEIAPKFARTFKDSSNENALAAFQSLINRGLELFKLHYVAPKFVKQAQPEIAIGMAIRLVGADRGENGPGKLHTDAYKIIAEVHGADNALIWMKESLPERFRFPASMFFLEEYQFDLLWEMYPDIDRIPYADVVWLYRAAGELSKEEVDSGRWKQIVDYFQTHGQSRYQIIGKHLAGLLSAADLEKHIVDTKSMAEVSYFMGVRAEYDNRWDDAEDWYRITLESGSTRDREYAWANRALYDFETRHWAWKNSDVTRN